LHKTFPGKNPGFSTKKTNQLPQDQEFLWPKLKNFYTPMRTVIATSLLFLSAAALAQPKSATTDAKYRRSSLYTLMMHNPNRPHAEEIRTAFTNSPIPDKFNDHIVGSRSIDMVDSAKDQTNNIVAYLEANHIARAVVAKWFNKSDKGFDMNLISDRGSYNASEMDVQKAKLNQRGLALLADAGEELIGNTFVLISDFRYVNKEEVAGQAKAGLKKIGGLLQDAGVDGAKDLSETAGEGLELAGKGYVVKTTSYLFRLDWNDSVSAVFYNEYWNNPSLFDNSEIFKLKLIGSEVAWADVQSSALTKKTEEELIVRATVKAVDAVISKLQKKHEEFRTKSPLMTDPLSAFIGMKEGLEEGDKFDVLEQTVNKEGRTVYEKIGVIKANKPVWDNRYMAGDEVALKEGEKPIDRSTFKKVSGKEFYPGLLIKQK
jgi:hypothetical protein